MENVWDYPRPPALVPCERRVRIELGGARIADSSAALRVLETSHPPAIYVPLADIAEGALRPAGGRSFCEWKGNAHYYDVLGGDEIRERATWGYAEPVARYAELRDHACFYPSRMDACLLDEERASPSRATSTAAGSPPSCRVPSRADRGRSAGEPYPRRMPDRAETLKKLDLVRILAAIDLAMLLVLVGFLIAGNGTVSPILGPIHGVLVLGLLYITGVGAFEKRWPWLFPVTTLLPILALIYDPKLRREIEADGSAA